MEMGFAENTEVAGPEIIIFLNTEITKAEKNYKTCFFIVCSNISSISCNCSTSSTISRRSNSRFRINSSRNTRSSSSAVEILLLFLLVVRVVLSVAESLLEVLVCNK